MYERIFSWRKNTPHTLGVVGNLEKMSEKESSFSDSLIKIKSHSVILIKDLNKYKAHGSGVLIRIKNLHLLISAAHVFDDFEKLYIPIENGKFMFKPGGEIISNHPKLSRENDNLDIGILILDLESIKELKTTYSFLEEEQVIINHNFEKNQYMLYGFPSTWSKKSFTKKSFHIRPFYNFTSPVKKSEYTRFNRDHYLNVIVEYDRKKALIVKKKMLNFGPDLFGMSGCGLWEINNLSKVNLVAIMTDWPKENRSRIIGVRIDIVTEFLRKYRNLDITESNLFSLK
ncbi:hypothetical protein LNI95_11490 [Tenacibaculum dicentrarchi]|uniref:hypothetical protein n=2 Tax=Tenacibaculum TaxID=104267 RepID=UPI001E6390F1|nr:hypothetical protein [Tenacibaculum dicentrarchi]WBX67943.1 hypothetical protein PG910_07345 [Tenacibaculum dicentrarchi]